MFMSKFFAIQCACPDAKCVKGSHTKRPKAANATNRQFRALGYTFTYSGIIIG